MLYTILPKDIQYIHINTSWIAKSTGKYWTCVFTNYSEWILSQWFNTVINYPAYSLDQKSCLDVPQGLVALPSHDSLWLGWSSKSTSADVPWYTPGATNIAGWEIHHEWRCISYKQWWFSIAMLVYQRVETNTNKTMKFLVGNPMVFFLEVCWEIHLVFQMFVCENSVPWNILMWLMFGVSSNFLVPMLVKRQNNYLLAKMVEKHGSWWEFWELLL